MLRQRLDTYFAEFDIDRSGALDRKELTSLLLSFFKRNNLNVPLDDQFVDEVFVDVDINEDGMIQVEELMLFFSPFVKMVLHMLRHVQRAKRISLVA